MLFGIVFIVVYFGIIDRVIVIIKCVGFWGLGYGFFLSGLF